jgi:hypothetical protein
MTVEICYSDLAHCERCRCWCQRKWSAMHLSTRSFMLKACVVRMEPLVHAYFAIECWVPSLCLQVAEEDFAGYESKSCTGVPFVTSLMSSKNGCASSCSAFLRALGSGSRHVLIRSSNCELRFGNLCVKSCSSVLHQTRGLSVSVKVPLKQACLKSYN